MLERLRIEERTMIFYEAPHRVAESIADAQEILGDRPACIAREVTKLHEEFLRGRLSELAASWSGKPARGEGYASAGPARRGGSGTDGLDPESGGARRGVDPASKLDRKEALKLAARERGLTRRAAYEQMVQSKKE